MWCRGNYNVWAQGERRRSRQAMNWSWWQFPVVWCFVRHRSNRSDEIRCDLYRGHRASIGLFESMEWWEAVAPLPHHPFIVMTRVLAAPVSQGHPIVVVIIITIVVDVPVEMGASIHIMSDFTGLSSCANCVMEEWLPSSTSCSFIDYWGETPQRS